MENQRLLVGLIGSGIGRSFTPALHEVEAAHHGIRLHYQTMDLDQLGLGAGEGPALVDAARRVGFRGVNVTHPCKQAVIAHLDEADADVKALGAANTVVFDHGQAVGHNTDLYGFRESFRHEFGDAPRRRVLLIGAGGAGAAVAAALLQLGTPSLTVTDADPTAAAALRARLLDRWPDAQVSVAGPTDLPALLAGTDGLVHATPLGMWGHRGCAVRAEWLENRPWVADVIYRPLDTELLRIARAVGCRTMTGGRMAVLQAAAAFAYFTGETPEVARMLSHFHQLVASEEQAGIRAR